MLMADVLSIFLVVVGLLLALQGLWLLCRSLWPVPVQAAGQIARRRWGKCLVVGVPITLGMILLTVVLAKFAAGAGGQVAAFGVVCAYIFYASAGVAGLSDLVGQGLPSPSDRDRPWLAGIRGGVALELAFLLPILGWFILLPLALILGCGAFTLALRQKAPSASATPLTSPEPPSATPEPEPELAETRR